MFGSITEEGNSSPSIVKQPNLREDYKDKVRDQSSILNCIHKLLKT